MRKILLLCAAMAVLLVGSLSIGVAAARTGAPVFYDARTPPGDVGRLDAQAESEPPGAGDGSAEGGDATGTDEAGEADPDEIDRGAGGSGGSGERPRATEAPQVPTPAPTPSPPASPDDGEGVATPPATPPEEPVPSAEEQAAWLGFQQLIRDCMTEAGFEYRHWEWWEAESPDPNSLAPAMPESLGDAEQAAWRAALYGDDGGDGCLVAAVEQDKDAALPSPEADLPETDVPEATTEPPSPSLDAVPEAGADGGTGPSVGTDPR